MEDRALPALEAPEDPASLFAQQPVRALSRHPHRRGRHAGDAFLAKNHRQPDPAAIHGGMTGAFSKPAIVGVTRELGASPPKPIGLTINYLRSGRALDSHARVSIVKQGRRVVAFEAQAWQQTRPNPSPRRSAISC